MTKAIMAMALLALCLAAQVGCGSPGRDVPPTPAAPTPVPTAASTPTPTAASTPAPTPVATATTLPTPTTALATPPPTNSARKACPLTTASVAPSPVAPQRPAAQLVSYAATTPPPPPSPLPVEDLIPLVDAIARVYVHSASEVVSVEESANADHWDWGGLTGRPPSRYVGVAEFKFEVLEWLKGGDGGNAAVGLTVVSARHTEEETCAAGKRNFERRDKRWENREAIVFMYNSHKSVPSSQESGRYFLSFLGDYALDAYRTWLPLAHYSQAPGASCEPEFLLKDPWTIVAPDAAAPPPEVETLTLSRLKSLLGLSTAELHKRAFSQRGWLEWNLSDPPETNLSDLGATSDLGEGVTLSWNNPGTNPDVIGYRILRRARYEPEFTELADVPVTPGGGHYEDKRDIQPQTQYIYILRAYGADGDIADARISITTVPALDPPDGASAASPANELKRAFSQKGWTERESYTSPESIIENLTATTRLGEGIRLSWSTSTANLDVIGHRIMRRARHEKEYAEIADVPVAAGGYYEDTQDLLPQTVYLYYFQAYGAHGDIVGEHGEIAAASIYITTVPYLDMDSLDASPARAPAALVPAAAQCDPPYADAPAADAPDLPFPDALPVIEERILNADVVAKVRLLGIRGRLYHMEKEEYEKADALNNIAVISHLDWDRIGIDATELEFEVLEYLKGGDGSAKIWGIVGVSTENLTYSQAGDVRFFYHDAVSQNKIWDDREAIVILTDLNSDDIPHNRYFMGSFKSNPVSYSLSSFGGWYPVALADAANPAEQRFLLADPAAAATPATGDMQDIPAITLSEFRLMAALPDAELEKRINSLTRVVELSASIPPETGLAYLYAATRAGEGIRLYWAASGANPAVLGYRILRRDNPAAAFTELADLPIAADGRYEATYEDKRDIRPDTGYAYILRAYGAAGDIADARISITTRPALEPLDDAPATPMATPAPE